MVSHDLSYTGAPLILLPVVNILQKYNFNICLLSYKDGLLRDAFEKKGIKVIVNDFINKDIKPFIKFAKSFDLVFANTIECSKVTHCLKGIKNVIWWLHEGEYINSYFIPNSRKSGISPFIDETLKIAKNIYVVSEYAKSCISNYNSNIQVLKYGFKDEAENSVFEKTFNNQKVIFSIFGSVEERKAHDVLLQAIDLLPNQYKKRIQLNIVGNNSSKWAQDLYKSYKNLTCVKWKGFVSLPEKSFLFKNTDVVVCISKDDPEPKVVAEAFMWSKVVLLSKNVGQKDLIEDNLNGFIVETNNVIDLKNKIIDIIDGKFNLEKIGKNARELYLNNYTLDVFETKLIKIIEESCK